MHQPECEFLTKSPRHLETKKNIETFAVACQWSLYKGYHLSSVLFYLTATRHRVKSSKQQQLQFFINILRDIKVNTHWFVRI